MASKLRVDSILPVDGAPTNGGGGIIQVIQTIKKDCSLKLLQQLVVVMQISQVYQRQLLLNLVRVK